MMENEMTKVYDAILCAPGMSDVVKIDLKPSRKTILLLKQLVASFNGKKKDDKSTLLTNVSPESLVELEEFINGCLEKAGLVEFSEKLARLNSGI